MPLGDEFQMSSQATRKAVESIVDWLLGDPECLSCGLKRSDHCECDCRAPRSSMCRCEKKRFFCYHGEKPTKCRGFKK